MVDLKTQKLELLGRTLWKGKVFYRDERVLRNRIEDLAVLAPLIDGDLSAIPKIKVDGKDQWLMFPARLYCGQSLLDSRRESIIIDYFFSDEISGYRERPDYLATCRGFQVRDEIRMVRPGFYLGRAYINRVFLLQLHALQQGDRRARRPGIRQTGRPPKIAGAARRRARSSSRRSDPACAARHDVHARGRPSSRQRAAVGRRSGRTRARPAAAGRALFDASRPTAIPFPLRGAGAQARAGRSAARRASAACTAC